MTSTFTLKAEGGIFHWNILFSCERFVDGDSMCELSLTWINHWCVLFVGIPISSVHLYTILHSAVAWT
jgi:hypothetical protein